MREHAPDLPERRSARLLILDATGRLLLFRYDDGRRAPFWATPGGQVLVGETYEQAAARELAEETGFDAPVGPLVRTRDEVFAAGDVPTSRWREHYFVVRVAGGAPDAARWTEEERRTIREARWWSPAELRGATEPVLPAWLPDVHASLQRYRPGGTIVLAPPSVAWATAFEREAAAIKDALPDLPIELHHIGSTAIPGIVAKPVIDMLGVVPALGVLDAREPRLAALGYEALGEYGIPGRRYFRKDAPDGTRTHQLHAFAAGSPEIRRHLDFRDYLRAFPAEAAAYAALKQELAGRCGSDMEAYGDGKTEFICAVERRAAEWRRNGG
jgi:GrpB-like predicted nucleotidyltransferase (UPF0157 family)/ADP-ribose pyrophosphatase YjhB (NUDIX family)